METGTAQRVVLVSAVMTFGLGWFNAGKKNENPSARFIIGTGVTFATLTILADFVPEVAGPMALAVVTTAFFTEGSAVFDYMNNTGEVGKKPTKTAAEAVNAEPMAQTTPTVKPDVGQVPGMKPRRPITVVTNGTSVFHSH